MYFPYTRLLHYFSKLIKIYRSTLLTQIPRRLVFFDRIEIKHNGDFLVQAKKNDWSKIFNEKYCIFKVPMMNSCC